MAEVYIGLGSNLDDPVGQLRRAKRALAARADCHILTDSGLFRSPPMTLPEDDRPQPDYINAVIKLHTDLSPHGLLDVLQTIEQAQGRVRERTWGPRTLDLDILMYDDVQTVDERLIIPHPGIAERDFVLYPLSVIDENMHIPGLGALSDILSRRPESTLDYLGPIDE